ncbi:MAG: DNA recombination protein RmuC [Campylobacter sp.]|nr:DNA recombination protein RmuC [Campylobacter sp.]
MNSSLIVAILALVIFVLLIILFFVLFFRQSLKLKDEIANLKNELNDKALQNKELIGEFNDTFIDRFMSVSSVMNDNNSKIDTKLSSNLSALNSSFLSLSHKISSLENLNETNSKLRDEVLKLNSIFSSSKHFGSYGEFELKQILRIAYGDDMRFYSLQHAYKNGCIVDLALRVGKDKLLSIDSKFPLFAFKEIMEAKNENSLQAKKRLLNDIKTQINSVSNKYIIPGVTLEYALIFIPSEAVYSYICANLDGILEYCYEKRVFLSSPMNFLNLIYTLQAFEKDSKMGENIQNIKDELAILSQKFAKFSKNSEMILSYSKKLNSAIEAQNKNSLEITKTFESLQKI